MSLYHSLLLQHRSLRIWCPGTKRHFDFIPIFFYTFVCFFLPACFFPLICNNFSKNINLTVSPCLVLDLGLACDMKKMALVEIFLSVLFVFPCQCHSTNSASSQSFIFHLQSHGGKHFSPPSWGGVSSQGECWTTLWLIEHPQADTSHLDTCKTFLLFQNSLLP